MEKEGSRGGEEWREGEQIGSGSRRRRGRRGEERGGGEGEATEGEEMRREEGEEGWEVA